VRDRWEALSTRTQVYLALPPMIVFWFLLNLGPFSQPLVRAAIYGLVEGGFFTAMLVWVTRNERERRQGGGR
jgi:hypothetical protein